MPEHAVRCLPAVTFQGGDERLAFEIDGAAKAVTLRIGGFNRGLVSELPDLALDLLEIAALVYGVDAAVGRGGPTGRRMGRDWYRIFHIEIPVRCLAAWQRAGVQRSLEEALEFLSGDRFRFRFVEHKSAPVESKWFDFDTEEGWKADRVVMFSGGLDSFAGALQEIVDQGHRVALVSHSSSTKIGPVQRDLYRAMARRLGERSCRHFPMRIQLTAGGNREGTHRTRSFLFAALGLVTALAFGRRRVSFHENGPVSLNLPPVANVVNTRASRTTHPQSLARFAGLFSRLLGTEIRVDNPSFWLTKTEVLQAISRLDMADEIAATSSCADTHNRTRQHPHCGRCSQCIDRRFAVLAAGLEAHDPPEAYAVDLLSGPRASGVDQEMLISYARNALAFEVIGIRELEQLFPEIHSATGYLGGAPTADLERVAGLLRRHGRAVVGILRDATERVPPGGYPDDSLIRLFGDLQRARALGLADVPSETTDIPIPAKVRLMIDRDRGRMSIDDNVILKKSATFDLLDVLAEVHLKALAQGLDLLDHPFLKTSTLARRFGMEDEASVRKRVNRSRLELRKRFASADLDEDLAEALIENLPWHGYRLAPDRVEIRLGAVGMDHSMTSKSSSCG